MTPDLTDHDALARHCIRTRDAIRRRVTTARAVIARWEPRPMPTSKEQP